MDERNPAPSPETQGTQPQSAQPQGQSQESYMGGSGDQPDITTNLDPDVPGGPTTAADRAATEAATDGYEGSGQSGAIPTDNQSDPARQMDNSGMLNPSGEGQDADIIGASGDDRNENR